MSVLVTNNISLTIGNSPVVRNVSLTIEAGEIISVIGPNGAGKTSLLKLLSGDVPASSGDIIFSGRPLDAWPLETLAQKRAVLPQLSLLNFPYTVEEVIALGRSPHATGQEYDEHIVQQLLSDFDLRHLQGRLYPQLSGGEKQRTQLARVIAQVWQEEEYENTLLILDEPTNALDLGHQQQLIRQLTQLAQKGLSVLLVVHDLNVSTKIADKVLLMCCGEAIAFGQPEHVMNQTTLSKVFGAELHIVKSPIDGALLVVS